MGWAKDNMSAAERETIARRLFEVDDKASGEDKKQEFWLRGLCPIHGESNPSFGYNVTQDYYKCLACNATGDLISLWSHAHGLDQAEGFRQFVALVGGMGVSAGPLSEPVQGQGRGRGRGTKKKPPYEAPVIPEDVWERMKPLPDEWVDRLGNIRGWTEVVIRGMDLRLQTVYRSKEGEIKEVPKPERVAIPIRDKDGKLRNIRLYKPGAKQRKIMSWAAGYGGARLFPAAPNDDAPILLCEGEPDTLCALSYGFNAITQTSKTSRWPKEHLEPFRGREVVICYDADQPGQDHAQTAIDNLLPVAASVRLLVWPDFMGRLADGSWPDDHGQDLTDFFVRHGKSAADLDALIAAARVIEPPPEEVAEDGGDDAQSLGYRRFFASSPGGRLSFKSRLLVDQIMKDMDLVSDPLTGELYRWNGHYWETYSEDHIKCQALQYLGREGNRNRAEDVAYQVRKLSTLPHGRTMNDHPDMVCVKNGMLDLKEFSRPGYKIAPHKKEYYATYELPVEFNPQSTEVCGRWLRYLDETIRTPAAIMQAQEFAGYCLTRDTRYEKCLLLLGDGADGKSTFLKVLQHLVGLENCSAVSFQDLDDQFQRSSIYNRLLNVSTEVTSQALESNLFKAIVSGDEINAAFKHQKSFEFFPFCKLAFAVNRLPRILDNSDGLFRKFLLIKFKRQFLHDADTGLFDTLLGELSEIFLWALMGLQRLREQDGFTECDETADLLIEYRRLNNPVLCFVLDECEVEEGCSCIKANLYQTYREYCRDNGYFQLSKENFFRELGQVIKLKQSRPSINGKRKYKVLGIKIKMSEEQ